MIRYNDFVRVTNPKSFYRGCVGRVIQAESVILDPLYSTSPKEKIKLTIISNMSENPEFWHPNNGTQKVNRDFTFTVNSDEISILHTNDRVFYYNEDEEIDLDDQRYNLSTDWCSTNENLVNIYRKNPDYDGLLQRVDRKDIKNLSENAPYPLFIKECTYTTHKDGIHENTEIKEIKLKPKKRTPLYK